MRSILTKTVNRYINLVLRLSGMNRHILVSDETLARLKSLAEPFVDREPEDVIRRLLDQLGEHGSINNAASNVGHNRGPSSDSRAPRERGARVKIGEETIEAVSVRDLYEQALRFFVENYKSKLQTILPLRTSRQRYLIARDPVHPGGNAFVVPVEVRGFHMEAHKDWKNGIEHLRALAGRLGVEIVYLG